MFSKSPALLLLIMLLLAACGSCSKSQPAREATPLDRLSEVGAQLNKGAAEFLKGGDPATAFKPWAAPPNPDMARMNSLREELKSAGVDSLVNLGFELELYFLSGDRTIYYLRTFVHTGEDGASFLNFEGRTETSGSSGIKVENLSGPAQPLRDATLALLGNFKGSDCAKLPFANPESVSRLITSETARGELIRRLEKAKSELGSTCSTLASLKYDEVRVRVDDQAYVARGGDGSAKGAVRGEFELFENNLGYALGGFRKF